MVCERVLEEEGVLGEITLGDYPLDWVPFEDDLISMELDNSTWKELKMVSVFDVKGGADIKMDEIRGA
jgi:hypothetical protein